MDKEEREKVLAHNKKLEHTNLNPFLCLKTAVSKDKKRMKVDGYDLDLTYITNYVVALGYPADGIQASIRNKREDVISFFKSRHGVNVKIYNLCIEKSKRYSQEDISEFGY
jgi:phosphatidylinositol-3,4,5-trisphosphate 3-phosphatase/dual-specificity protein phosphatase PTEN